MMFLFAYRKLLPRRKTWWSLDVAFVMYFRHLFRVHTEWKIYLLNKFILRQLFLFFFPINWLKLFLVGHTPSTPIITIFIITKSVISLWSSLSPLNYHDVHNILLWELAKTSTYIFRDFTDTRKHHTPEKHQSSGKWIILQLRLNCKIDMMSYWQTLQNKYLILCKLKVSHWNYVKLP